MIGRHPMAVGIAAAVLALLSAAGTIVAISQLSSTQAKQFQIEQRVTRDERPTQAQLIAGILRALAVCHASPVCSRALTLAKRGISPSTGKLAVPNPAAPALPPSNRPHSPAITTPQLIPHSHLPQLPTAPTPPSTGTTSTSSPPPPPKPPPPKPPVPPLPPVPIPPGICTIVRPLCGLTKIAAFIPLT